MLFLVSLDKSMMFVAFVEKKNQEGVINTLPNPSLYLRYNHKNMTCKINM